MSHISFPRHLIKSAALFVASDISVSNMDLKLYGAYIKQQSKEQIRYTSLFHLFYNLYAYIPRKNRKRRQVIKWFKKSTTQKEPEFLSEERHEVP